MASPYTLASHHKATGSGRRRRNNRHRERELQIATETGSLARPLVCRPDRPDRRAGARPLAPSRLVCRLSERACRPERVGDWLALIFYELARQQIRPASHLRRPFRRRRRLRDASLATSYPCRLRRTFGARLGGSAVSDSLALDFVSAPPPKRLSRSKKKGAAIWSANEPPSRRLSIRRTLIYLARAPETGSLGRPLAAGPTTCFVGGRAAGHSLY